VAEDLIQLAERFVRLSGELDATCEAMKRLLLKKRCYSLSQFSLAFYSPSS
jgi:hypothetical protein